MRRVRSAGRGEMRSDPGTEGIVGRICSTGRDVKDDEREDCEDNTASCGEMQVC